VSTICVSICDCHRLIRYCIFDELVQSREKEEEKEEAERKAKVAEEILKMEKNRSIRAKRATSEARRRKVTKGD
jgi:hypothetical protein